MGASPAEPMQVIVLIGAIILISLLLSLSIYTRRWMKRNPGILEAKFTEFKNWVFAYWQRIREKIRHYEFGHAHETNRMHQ